MQRLSGPSILLRKYTLHMKWCNRQRIPALRQRYRSEAFPNPHRIHCPDLTRMAERPRDADPSISEHLAYCYPALAVQLLQNCDMCQKGASKDSPDQMLRQANGASTANP